MRRVHPSIKVGRRGKRNKEIKGLQGGGVLRGAGLRLGRVSPGQESTVQEKQKRHQPSRRERCCQGVGVGPQEGRDALRLPGALTEHLRPRESVPHPPAELSTGLQRAPLGPGRAGRGSGEGSTEEAARPASPGHRIRRSSPGQAEAGRAQESEDAPAAGWPPVVQICAPTS